MNRYVFQLDLCIPHIFMLMFKVSLTTNRKIIYTDIIR